MIFTEDPVGGSRGEESLFDNQGQSKNVPRPDNKCRGPYVEAGLVLC